MGKMIKIIIPNSLVKFSDSQIKIRKSAAASDFEVDVVCLPYSPVSIASAYNEALAALYIIEEVKKAEQDVYSLSYTGR